MKTLSLLLLSALGLTLSSHAALAQSAPQGVRITRVGAAGNGCMPGTVQSVLSPDSKDLSLLFDNFVTESGTNQAPDVDKKVCVITVRLAIPNGWSMALIGADYRGYAGIEAGGVASHEALYSFNKDYAGSSFTSKAMRGPMNETYLHHTDLRADLVNWSTCNLATVDLTVRVSLVAQSPYYNGRKPVSMLTVDSLDTSTRQSFTVGWRPCNGGGGGGGTRPPPTRPPGGGGPLTYDVYQLWDGRDRYLTIDGRLVETGAWVNQGTAFRVYRNQRDLGGLVGLHSCLDTSVNKHFVSTDRYCEGQRYDRDLGFISSYQQANTVALVEYVNPRDRRDRIFTTRADEAAGYRAYRTVGFVVQTR